MGPRIWPSGADDPRRPSGHADLRGPNEPLAPFYPGKVPQAEKVWASVIADGRAEVLTAVREEPAAGRKARSRSPRAVGQARNMIRLDVTPIHARRDARSGSRCPASDWNTYVHPVHRLSPQKYDPPRGFEAGVKVIEHGNLLDEDTLKLMGRKKGIWLSGQMLVDSTEGKWIPKGGREEAQACDRPRGRKIVWPMAKRLGRETRPGGTDFLLRARISNEQQNAYNFCG